MRTICVIVAAFTVLILAVDVHAAPPAAQGCLILCGVRHPIRWHDHRCESWRCRAQREQRAHPQRKQLYPCVVRWTYDGLRWWHLRYGPRGPYGRNHVGYGPSYRRCW